MTMYSIGRRLACEALGTALLLAAVIGSGIMGERLSAGNDAITLLANAISTGAALVVLITIFGPLSGAHFNPVVTLAAALRRDLTARRAVGYAVAQIIGALVGVLIAHAMFEEPLFQVSEKLRDGTGQAFSEIIATFGLILTIFATARFRPDFVATSVGLYISAAYWFTASTSFANPAVTIARMFSNTFAGIDPSSAPAFIAAQLVGALVAAGALRWLFRENK